MTILKPRLMYYTRKQSQDIQRVKKRSRHNQTEQADGGAWITVSCALLSSVVNYLSGVHLVEKAYRRYQQPVPARKDSTRSTSLPAKSLLQSDHPQDTTALVAQDCDADSRANPDYEMEVGGQQGCIVLRCLAVGGAGDQERERYFPRQYQNGPVEQTQDAVEALQESQQGSVPVT